MHPNKVAVKYVNVVDRVRPVDPQSTLVPAYTVIQKVGEDIDIAVTPQRSFYDGAMSEFDDRTLADLVGRGLQGQ